jgi:hypothetical protein
MQKKQFPTPKPANRDPTPGESTNAQEHQIPFHIDITLLPRGWVHDEWKQVVH